MKKCLLLPIALGVSGIMLAQSIPHSITPQKQSNSLKSKKELYKLNQLPGADVPSFAAMAAAGTAPAHKQLPTQKTYTTTVIGNTGYQLQTNAAICNRAVKSNDGTISATWTMSQALNDGVWTDRGTGYNYFNGSAWGAIPTARIENTRCGFTNVGISSTGAEFVVTHEAANIHVASRSAKGTGTWSNSTLGYPDVWSRMATGGAAGTSIHVISQTKGTGNPPFHGQDGGISYSRSTDNGVSWDKIQSLIPEIDSSNYVKFGGDSYAIDARGDTVAIVIGGFDVDVILLKSVNNGNSWTKTIVKAFPIPMFNDQLSDIDGDGVADIIPTNDASVAVLLDNNGKAHVWYGYMEMTDDTPGDGSVSYYPGMDGLMYWNENMGATAPVMIAAAEDLNGDDSLNITGYGTYQVSLTSHPSPGIDAAGNIYVSYSSIYENDPDGSGKNFRHTYVMRSEDGGATWCTPRDVTDPGGVITYIEGVYGAMARRVDGFVHLIVQQDGDVGHGVSTATSPDPQTGMADIVYVKIPVADLACTVGIDENSASISTSIYPNPANGSAVLSITAFNRTTASIKMYNVIGELVNGFTKEIPAAGTHNVDINLEKYPKGVYFVNVTMDGKTATEKLVVE
jgi:hypothetical protein